MNKTGEICEMSGYAFWVIPMAVVVATQQVKSMRYQCGAETHFYQSNHVKRARFGNGLGTSSN